ncbi:hypothetical protein JB92DRAFT_3094726 [Gautieria morchelliformis]|nr:hypothetical protein JB92DRAFT_3094726 [Gautieria morchelliformis]
MHFFLMTGRDANGSAATDAGNPATTNRTQFSQRTEIQIQQHIARCFLDVKEDPQAMFSPLGARSLLEPHPRMSQDSKSLKAWAPIVKRELSPDLIEVKVKVEDQDDKFKYVSFIEKHGMLDIWNLDGFDLGPDSHLLSRRQRVKAGIMSVGPESRSARLTFLLENGTPNCELPRETRVVHLEDEDARRSRRIAKLPKRRTSTILG